jgi:hypothetical protein
LIPGLTQSASDEEESVPSVSQRCVNELLQSFGLGKLVWNDIKFSFVPEPVQNPAPKSKVTIFFGGSHCKDFSLIVALGFEKC